MFPDSALDVAVELKLGDNWTDITPHVYKRDPITITRGRQDEGSRMDPSTCSLTINNRDGRYSPRNVMGPYYGLLGRNTPIRVSAGTGTMALRIPDVDGSGASTPDTAALDITGDLDVRVDAAMSWVNRSGGMVGKYVETGGQRSWIFWLNPDRTLTLFWSTTGANLLSATSTAPISVAAGRAAVRVTLDVNNGASGRTITFYTSDTITGSWTQLGSAVVQAGTTSIFNSTSPLVVGDVFGTLPARYLKTEVRNGIGGTVAANPDFTAQTAGATSFSDAAGRSWTVTGEALLTARSIRFMGEVPAWPVRWGPSGQDVHVQIEAAGITRRLGQGRKPLASVLRRSIAKFAPYTAWWPLEEPAGATRGAGGYPNMIPMTLTGDATFTGEASGGTAGGLTMSETGRAFASVSGCPNTWIVTFWLDVPAMTTEVSPIVQWRTPGAPRGVSWSLYTGGTINGLMFLEVADATNTIVLSAGGTIDVRQQGPVQILLRVSQLGADVNVTTFVDGEFDIQQTIFNDTASPVTSIGVNMSTSLGSQYAGSVSHLVVAPFSRNDELLLGHIGAGSGYRGEAAGDRFARLCDEEALPAAVLGDAADTEAMGPQLPAPILELLGDCEDSDGGAFYEARDELALRYRPRATDYNTPAALVLDYHDQVAYPLEPVDDDQNTRNDVTVERTGGSSARVVVEDGPLSTQAPPDGVGVYDESVTLNVATDSQLLPIAGWRAHLGTVDEARYPVVRVKLHKHPDLIDAVTSMDLRARIHLTGLPAWEPPGTVDLIADGYTETIEPLRWMIEYNTVPGSPWRTGVLDDTTLGRVDTDGSILAKAATSSDTTFLVTSTDGPAWTTDAAEVPFDVKVGGEVATVTAVGNGLLDGFDRTTSNGWGAAPDGQAWTVIGTASRFSTASSEGRITYSTTNAADIAALGQHCEAVDVELAFKSPVAAFTGAAPFLYLIGAYDRTANDWYALVMILNTDNTVGVFFERKTAGTTTALNGITIVPGVTLNNTATFRARLQVQGGLLLGRVWNGANPEPPNWHTAFWDSTNTGGGDVGVQVFLPAGVTNTLPLTFAFPEFKLRNPQKLTVTRSVNGISKAQVAGADVRLAQPSVIAL
jgi:hypothetical protein